MLLILFVGMCSFLGQVKVRAKLVLFEACTILLFDACVELIAEEENRG
jgi:hypothetical protein